MPNGDHPYHELWESVRDYQQSTKDEASRLRATIAARDRRIAELEAENAALRRVLAQTK